MKASCLVSPTPPFDGNNAAGVFRDGHARQSKRWGAATRNHSTLQKCQPSPARGESQNTSVGGGMQSRRRFSCPISCERDVCRWPAMYTHGPPYGAASRKVSVRSCRWCCGAVSATAAAMATWHFLAAALTLQACKRICTWPLPLWLRSADGCGPLCICRQCKDTRRLHFTISLTHTGAISPDN